MMQINCLVQVLDYEMQKKSGIKNPKVTACDRCPLAEGCRIHRCRECEYCCYRQVPAELPPCRGCPCSRDVFEGSDIVAKADAKLPVETFNNYMKE